MKISQLSPSSSYAERIDAVRFYKSVVWLELRYRVLKHFGSQCMVCWRTPKRDGVTICVDHIKPVRNHPELAHDPDNLQVLCSDCNRGKSYWDETDHRPPLAGPVPPSPQGKLFA